MKQKKYEWFLPYRYAAPADLEAHLEANAAAGWHAGRIRQWDSIHMPFEKGDPQQMRYVVDLNAFPKADYRPTYEQFGWELAGKMASLYVWRKPYTGTRPEAFTDRESLVRRSANLSTVLMVLFVVLLAVVVILTVLFFAVNTDRSGNALAGYGITTGLCVLLAIGLGLSWRTVRKNKAR